MIAVWGLAYLVVRRTAHLELPHGIERDPAVIATPLLARWLRAAVGSLRAVASLTLVRAPQDLFAYAAGAAVTLTVASALGASAAARASAARAWPWVLWGLVWFALASGTLPPSRCAAQPQPVRQHRTRGIGLVAPIRATRPIPSPMLPNWLRLGCHNGDGGKRRRGEREPHQPHRTHGHARAALARAAAPRPAPKRPSASRPPPPRRRTGPAVPAPASGSRSLAGCRPRPQPPREERGRDHRRIAFGRVATRGGRYAARPGRRAPTPQSPRPWPAPSAAAHRGHGDRRATAAS